MAPEKSRRALCSAVAHVLHDERKKRGLSLTAVATTAGLSRQMISFVEEEERNPTLDTLLRICDALEINFIDVLKRAAKAAKK